MEKCALLGGAKDGQPGRQKVTRRRKKISLRPPAATSRDGAEPVCASAHDDGWQDPEGERHTIADFYFLLGVREMLIVPTTVLIFRSFRFFTLQLSEASQKLVEPVSFPAVPAFFRQKCLCFCLFG